MIVTLGEKEPMWSAEGGTSAGVTKGIEEKLEEAGRGTTQLPTRGGNQRVQDGKPRPFT